MSVEDSGKEQQGKLERLKAVLQGHSGQVYPRNRGDTVESQTEQ